jgi:uracil-DNA glycosylase
MNIDEINLQFNTWSKLIIDNPLVMKELDVVMQQIEPLYGLYRGKIFPEKSNIFRCFREINIETCKYVLIGQDPYHNVYNNVPSACGLSFVTENGYINPSLRILSASLGIDPLEFKDFMLDNRVLLLNTTLTVFRSQPNSHIDVWSKFTKILINKISREKTNLNWILLGGDAKALKSEILMGNIYTAIHPAAYVNQDRKVQELQNLFIDCNLINRK